MSRRELLAMRPGSAEDLPQLYQLLRGEVARGRQDMVPNEPRLQRMLARFDWKAKSRVVVDGGVMTGAVFVISRPSVDGVLANIYAAGETEVYRELLRWGVDFARAAGAAVSQVFIGRDRGADIAGLGLERVRPWWRMDRSLVEDLPAARGVDGYELIDGTAAPRGTWGHTFNQTFADHWRFAARAEQELVADKVPRLCLMAVTTGRRSPAAMTLGELDHYAGDPRPQPVGLVSSVGTVPEHRRRGLARWLVVEILHRLRDAGARHASLYVDGGNPTRAYEIYRKLGFEVVFEAEVWEASVP